MENTLILAIVLVIVVLALLRAKKHFKGGGCCGSGGTVVRTKKELTDPVITTRTLTVEGMTCENCQARVENTINRLDGAACLVNLRKKQAVISLSREIPDAELKAAIEARGYKVTAIR